MAPALPKDSLILVTGANGYIGSHVVDQFLEAGYRVRGTTRSIQKIQALSALWEKKFGPGRFEATVVPDMSKEGAFDEAVKGVDGIAHVASDMSFSPDPNAVIPTVLAGVNGMLKSAAASPSVKRFVYTSSSTATTGPKPNQEFEITPETWNDEQIKAAWAPPPYEQSRGVVVYSSSKAEAEKAVWKFVKENKPGFVTNTVLPNANYGKILVKGQPASTGWWITSLYNGDIEPVKHIPPQWYVDVQDTARLHVAAMVNADVSNERIFAFAEPFTWNKILRILKKIAPDHKFPDEFTDESVKDLSKVANGRAIELLKGFGQNGFTGLEQSLRANIEDL